MRTLRLVIEYDGTHFAGWQSQKSDRTVQDALEQALHILLKEPVRLIGAGRTDAGTHALGQVAHFQTEAALPTDRLLRSLNGLLPPDIAVRAADEVAADFHARYSATRKRYRYRIHQGKAAVNRTQVWTYYSEISLDPMAAAARALCGERAFGAFCKQDPIPEHLTCHVFDAVWSQRGPELIFEIEANRFPPPHGADPRRHHGRNRSRYEAAGGHRRPARQRRPRRSRCHSSCVRPLPALGGVPR